MKINEAYLDFYEKNLMHHTAGYKLSNDDRINEAFAGMKRIPSKLSMKNICIFNPYSLTNVIRANECDYAVLSEADKKTASLDVFAKTIGDFFLDAMKNSKVIMNNAENAMEFNAKFPNDDKSIYAIVLFKFVFDLAKHDVDYYVHLLARRAHLMNYNLVDYNTIETTNVSYNGSRAKLAVVRLEFEAAYQDNIYLGINRYVYHVTTENAAKKILAAGITPRNSNLVGLKYPDRVYVFIDKEKANKYSTAYAYLSKKTNKEWLDKDHLLKLSKEKLDELVEKYKDLQKKNSNDGLVVDNRKFVILQIDLQKAGDVKFYMDPYTLKDKSKTLAAYTYQAIPAKAISCYRKIEAPKSI